MIKVTEFQRLPKYEKQYAKLSPEIQTAVDAALDLLITNPTASSLRCHPLHGFRPTIWKIDVLPNKSWQITFELRSTTAVLRKVAPHSELDRSP